MTGITKERKAMAKQWRNTDKSYGMAVISVHWVMALAVIAMYPLGLYIVDLTYYDPEYKVVPHWHKSIGILFGLLLAFRFGWKLFNKHPAAPANHSQAIRLLTKLGHAALYLLMLAVVISGYLISTADGRAIDVFNWFAIPATPALIENQEDVAGVIHYWSATALIVMAGLHALAALKHHFIDRDETLKRIVGIQQENS